jgi:anaerobic ribonucleoside-triphosphate reductase activating protein
MYYSGIKKLDVANGPGLRVTLFVSGCTHHCKGCFNKETWDFQYGNPFTKDTEEEIMAELQRPQVAGLTLLGGEPFERVNQQGLLPLLRRVKAEYPKKPLWCFTGYDFEKDILGQMVPNWDETKEFLSYLDILVDGEFVEEKKDLTLRFKGSSNQRTIMVPESLKEGKVVLWKFA